MEKIAVFPGSFDPFTIGHESIVRRGLQLFDKIIVAIGTNTDKTDYFPLETRMKWIKKVFEDEPRIKVDSYNSLTVNYCKKMKARYLLRGLRTAADFEYERVIAQVNHAMEKEIEVVFLLTLPEHTFINSTVVREVIKFGGDARKFLPEAIDLTEMRP
ncbi:MAG TPA: pantetheine-phosphate adenylyltransferase [Bacteroidetes bacterium]|nr:pantetheine-phosphate adenylyltransferase [Bacteroidota bacterium]